MKSRRTQVGNLSIPTHRLPSAYLAKEAIACAAVKPSTPTIVPTLLAALIALREDHSRAEPHHEDMCPLCKQADAAIRLARLA